MLDWLIALDKELLLFLNLHHTPFVDAFMIMVSGKVIWSVFYISIIYAFLKQYGYKHTFLILISIGVLMVFCDQIASGIFKPFFQRFRPSHDPELKNLVHVINDYRGGKFGFASSHASNTFGLAFFLSFLFKNKMLNIFLFSWAILVAYSRIHLGVHYPGDIAMGALIAFASAKLVFYFYDRFLVDKFLNPSIQNKTKTSEIIITWGMVQIAVMLFCSYYVVKGIF